MKKSRQQLKELGRLRKERERKERGLVRAAAQTPAFLDERVPQGGSIRIDPQSRRGVATPTGKRK